MIIKVAKSGIIIIIISVISIIIILFMLLKSIPKDSEFSCKIGIPNVLYINFDNKKSENPDVDSPENIETND